jgi:hypothetical protein
MKFNFDFFSFVIGALFGSVSVWKLLQHRIEKSKLQLKQAEASNEIRNRLFELMSLLKDKRELFADIRDGKLEIDGIQTNILKQLQTEIDLIYDDIIENEKQLAKIENRKPRKISKSHGGRPATAGPQSISNE